MLIFLAHMHFLLYLCTRNQMKTAKTLHFDFISVGVSFSVSFVYACNGPFLWRRFCVCRYSCVGTIKVIIAFYELRFDYRGPHEIIVRPKGDKNLVGEWGERRHMSPNDAEHQSSRLCCRTRVLFEIMIWWKKTDKGKTRTIGLFPLLLPPRYHLVTTLNVTVLAWKGAFQGAAMSWVVLIEW